MGKLEDPVAVGTGSSRGLARAIVEAFLAEGASVVVNGRSEEKGLRAVVELGAGAATSFVASDVGRREGCERVVGEAIERWGRIDVLVNNAGNTFQPTPVSEMTDETLQVTLEWTLWSTGWCTRLAPVGMIPRRSGRIINVSSSEGKRGSPVTSAYTAAKHSVNGFTRSCAWEVGVGITVNALCAGAMRTDVWDEVGPKIAAEEGMTLEKFFPLLATEAATKKITEVEDVAAVAVLLASDAGAGISGSLISIDGGTVPF